VIQMSLEYAKSYAKLIGKSMPLEEDLEGLDSKKAIRDLIKSQTDLKPKSKKESVKSGKVKESTISEGTKE